MWNCGLTHDLLEQIEEVEEVVLAHLLKTRLVAHAQIKTGQPVFEWSAWNVLKLSVFHDHRETRSARNCDLSHPLRRDRAKTYLGS